MRVARNWKKRSISRHEAAHDALADRLAQRRLDDDEVARLFSRWSITVCVLPALVEQKAGIGAAHLLVEAHQLLAEVELEHARHDQGRREQRHARVGVDVGQRRNDVARACAAWPFG